MSRHQSWDDFKVAAGQPLTHGCVSSAHPAAEESPSVSSSSRLTLSLQDCHLRYCGAISLLLLKQWGQEQPPSCQHQPHQNWREKCSLVVYFVPQLTGLTNVCRTITELSPPVLPLYGEIKENHEGYLNLSWHSRSENGVGCSTLIKDTLERCLALYQTAFHWCAVSWCKRALQWPGKSPPVTLLSDTDVKHDASKHWWLRML